MTKENSKAQSKRLKWFENKLEYLIGILLPVIIIIFSTTSFFKGTENSVYDMMLHVSPGSEKVEDLVILEINDPSIAAIGTWPWSRDVLGSVLLRLREFDVKTAVFDIEYLSPGLVSVDSNYAKNDFPQVWQYVSSEIEDKVSSLGHALSENSSSNEEKAKNLSENTIVPLLNQLYEEISTNILSDNDTYFAKCIRFFGRTFLTINTQDINGVNPDLEAVDFVCNNFVLKNIVDKNGLIDANNKYNRELFGAEYGIAPAIYPLAKEALGVGFPNVVIDSDGVRRRIELINHFEEYYFGQLVFSPIVYLLSPKEIRRENSELKLIEANFPDGTVKDVSIPLDQNGNMLIKWIPDSFFDSFKSEAVYMITQLDLWESAIVSHLQAISQYNIRTSDGYLSYRDGSLWLLGEYAEISSFKDSLMDGSSDDFDGYFEKRKEFFENVEYFLQGGFDTELYDLFGNLRVAANDQTLYKDIEDNIRQRFSSFLADYTNYVEEKNRMEPLFKDSFVLIGNTASATTDLGVTPFQESYPNVGTHANIYNSIMSEQFIKPIPPFISCILALVLSFLLVFCFRKIQNLVFRIIAGIVYIALVILITFGLFSFFNLYLESLVIYVSVIIVFVAITIVRLLSTEKDKLFMRKAFSTYVSDSVVAELVKNHEKLSLGGEEKQITALFTDIKSFSTFSEKVTPTQLVTILNRYLTVMSDIILEQKGTIDKYIGDAIVSFFGAPNALPNNAASAVSSALLMKDAEVEINKKLQEDNLLPTPILTRIGINTGPMVVGNMGTEQKMNFTIMGNDVNLASRLEGVNKIYGTWIMASEFTVKNAGSDFTFRRLDKVRVMGVSTPVQLYEVVDFANRISESKLKTIEAFHAALDVYLEKDFVRAAQMFENVLNIDKDDAPSQIYLTRCKKYMEEGIPKGWDGVYSMTTK